MNNNLYEKLISNISKAVFSQTLNEMAKDISYRNIDKKLWLSVASTCSRNKSTEAEFIKPSGPDKNDAGKMMQRYIVALIVMGKPCPRSAEDIDKIKTFKLIGKRALELGATIKDIENCYNNNTGGAKAYNTEVQPPMRKSVNELPTPEKNTANIQNNKLKKEFKLLETLTADININEIMKLEVYSDGYVRTYRENDEIVKLCNKAVSAYLKKQIKKCNNDIKIFGENIKADFLPALQILGEMHNKQYDKILDFNFYIREQYTLNYILSKTNNKLFTHFYGRFNSYDTNCDQDDIANFFKNIEKYQCSANKKGINILTEYMVPSFFKFVIYPYLQYKKKEIQNNNIANVDNTLQKYNMVNEPSDYWQWFCNNIKKLIDNNPGINIPINYSDWSGQVEYAFKSSDGKYYISLYLQSGNSDTGADDYLSKLTNLRSRDTYSYRYVDNRNISWVPDPDDCIYTCTVHDLDALAKKAYNTAKKLVTNGQLQ